MTPELYPPATTPLLEFAALADAFAQSPAFMCVLRGPDHVFTFTNEQYQRLIGGRDVLGRPIREALPEVAGQGYFERLDEVYRTGERHVAERAPVQLQRRADAGPEERLVDFVYTPIRDEEGRVNGIFVHGVDATEHVHVLTAARASEERLRLILESVPDYAIFMLDPQGRITSWNRGAQRVFGWREAEVLGRDSLMLWTPEDRNAGSLGRLLAAAREHGRAEDERWRIRKDGTRFFAAGVASTIHDAVGNLIGYTKVCRDVTQRKLDDERLRESEERFRATFEQAVVGVVLTDGKGRVVRANEAFCRMLGRPFSELVGRDSSGYTHPDDLEQNAKNVARIESQAAPSIVFEKRYLRPDGEVVWAQASLSALRSADGAVVNLIAIVEDITEAKSARDAMRRGESRFRQLADAMPQIVFAADPTGHVDYFNQRWYEYTGIPEGEIGYESWKHVHEPSELERAASVWAEALRTGGLYEIEYRLRRRDGVFRWHLGRALPVRDEAGRIVRWFGTNTDIHDQKELQAQNEHLLASERAARSEAERVNRLKDEFLATLGHELRTPLNAILGWSQLLRGGRVSEGDTPRGLETIERNARAQAQIIEDLLDMSRMISGKVRLDVQRIDLASVVGQAVETVRPTAETKGVRLHAVLDPHAGPVSGDPNRLQQVFWNLLSNAIKFTPKGGRVQVILERIHSHLEVSVIDTGEGIRPEFLPHVFDRFRQADASTTRTHGGLGLGLAIVKQLIELHGGTVQVKSPGPGQGATFTVRLPLTVVHPPAEDEPARRHPRTPGRLLDTDLCVELAGVRVLVVDDEPDAQALVQRLLEDCDAIVTTAGSAAEAVSHLEQGPFDVLVSDIGMPGEDGYSLIRRVRALGPARGDVPALALTAYARAEDRVRCVLAGFQMHVPKPVEPTELIAMVASLAGRTGDD